MSSLRTTAASQPAWPRSLRDALSRAQAPGLEPSRRHELLRAAFGEVFGRLAAIAWTAGAAPPPDKALVWGDWLKAALSTGRLGDPVAADLSRALSAQLPKNSSLAVVGTELAKRWHGGRVKSVNAFLQAMVAYRNRYWAHGHHGRIDAAEADAIHLASTSGELADRLIVLGRYRFALLHAVELRSEGVHVCRIERPDGEPPPEDIVAMGDAPRPGDTWLFDASDRWRPVGPSSPWLHVAECGECRAYRAFALDRRKTRPEWLGVSAACGHARADLDSAAGALESARSSIPTVVEPLRSISGRQEHVLPMEESAIHLGEEAPASLPLLPVSAVVPPRQSSSSRSWWFAGGLAVGLGLLGVLGLSHRPPNVQATAGVAAPPESSAECPCSENPTTSVDPRCPQETWGNESRASVVAAGTKKIREANELRKRSAAQSRLLATEALHIYDCALRLKPADARVLGDMGWAFALAGDGPGAVRFYERAIRSGGHPNLVAAAHFGRGEALCKMGRAGEALESMRKALETPNKKGVQAYREKQVARLTAACR